MLKVERTQPKGWVNYAVAGVIPLALILTWELATRENLLPPSQSAAPSEVIQKLINLLISGELVRQALYSCLRLLTGVALGTFLGICSGLLLAYSRKADRLLSPTMQFLAPIPAIVWIPFLIMFFGIGETSKLALIVLCVFFLLHINTFQAVQAVERDYVELADVYEKNYWSKLWHVFLPSAAPGILTALRVSLALGWIVLFVVEYGYSNQKDGGLGWFIANARGFGRVDDQFAGVVLLGGIGFLLDRLVAYVQKRILIWRDSFETLTM